MLEMNVYEFFVYQVGKKDLRIKKYITHLSTLVIFCCLDQH